MNSNLKFLVATALSAAVAAIGSSVLASESPRQLNWPDLQPPSIKQLQEQAYGINRKLDALPEAKRDAYDLVQEELDLRKRIELGFLAEDRLDDETRALLADPPSKKYPEAAAFWQNVSDLEQKIRDQQHKTNDGLNGKAVRIPGYILPLEFKDDKVIEFLLVPYVGACIHAPTPPANQMVFVTVKEAFKSVALYEAVWVEGVIRSEKGTHNLSLVDGSSDVVASYAMSATQIKPYKR